MERSIGGSVWRLLSRYWEVRGNYTEGRALLLRILAAQKATVTLDPVAPDKQTKLHYYAGRLSLFLSYYPQARSLLEKGLRLSKEAGLDERNCRINNQLGLVAWQGGDYAVAVLRFEASLKKSPGNRNRVNIASLLWSLVVVLWASAAISRVPSYY